LRPAKPNTASAFAPASVGNVAVGFDILGHALEGVGDTVHARRIDALEVRVDAVCGLVTELPRDPQRNTAARAVAALLAATQPGFGVSLALDKGIPLGSGMGGSAASASAALVAVNALLDQPLSREALYPFALEGEFAASGGYHGDNLGAQLLGGLVLATREHLVQVPVPAGLTAVLVHPPAVLETRRAREVLAQPFGIADVVRQNGHLALLLAGCWRGDMGLIRAGLNDVLIEPRRAPLIAGFAQVKQCALDHDALGASISGAGPSVFAWFADRATAQRAAPAMAQVFGASYAGAACDVYVSAVAAAGARLLPESPR